MITKSQPTQITLNEGGQIFWQESVSNPLPGIAIGKVVKGPMVFKPAAVVDDPRGEDEAAVQAFVQAWLENHIATVLEPLPALENKEGLNEAVAAIVGQVYDHMGTVPREAVDHLTEKLEPEDRKALRDKKIKLGPLLVFMPLLNKPVAVRLRALLWNLWNDKPLPANVPADGIVSFKPEEGADPLYYRTIGYPIYGPRAIRIDMLDRVICAVYDSADKGKFQAQHQMAEWLGCSIGDLYDVLESMGHKKIEDPADAAEETAAPKEEQVKPELATFRLKKGKAFAEEKKQSAASKPKAKKKKQDKPKKEPRIMSAESKKDPADSPFAILEQLKAKSE